VSCVGMSNTLSIAPYNSRVFVVPSHSFSSNKLTGTIPDIFASMPSMKVFRVNDNLLAGPVPASFSSVLAMEEFRIENNLLTGTVPLAVCATFNSALTVASADCQTEITCACCQECF
jgi:hypothetical protein